MPVFFIAECVAFCLNFGKSASPAPYNQTIYFSLLIFIFDACVGISSVQMWNRPHNKGLTMSKMPPVATSGKLAKASKCKHAHQVLKSEQQQSDLVWRGGNASMVCSAQAAVAVRGG
jgi:hypothetical protein